MKEKEALIEYTAVFHRQRKAAPLDIKIAFRDTLELFLYNQKHSSLRNHSLKEKFTGYRSIDVTDDWRAIYKKKVSMNKTIITFHLLGTHTQLYKKR